MGPSKLKKALHFALLYLVVRGVDAADITSKNETFSVTFPEGFSIVKASPVEDFEIYRISKGTRAFVVVYIGNQPTFPKQVASPTSQVRMLSANGVQILSEWQSTVLIHRELLVDFGAGSRWPASLHAWTSVTTPSDVVVADQILLSIHARN